MLLTACVQVWISLNLLLPSQKFSQHIPRNRVPSQGNPFLHRLSAKSNGNVYGFPWMHDVEKWIESSIPLLPAHLSIYNRKTSVCPTHQAFKDIHKIVVWDKGHVISIISQHNWWHIHGSTNLKKIISTPRTEHFGVSVMKTRPAHSLRLCSCKS